MINKCSSEITTQSIRILAEPSFQPDYSDIEKNKWVFSYRITIFNEGESGVRLRSRMWKIIDFAGEEKDVRGEGVVGLQPHLKSGDKFSYDSFCVLDTPFGTMEGFYLFERDDGDLVKIPVGRFYLNAPEGQ